MAEVASVLAGEPGRRAARRVEPCPMDRVERMQRRFEVPVMIAAVLVIPRWRWYEPTRTRPRGGREWF
jgi:hypothetical protein